MCSVWPPVWKSISPTPWPTRWSAPPEKLGSRPGHNNYIMNELGVGYRMIDADHDGPDAPVGHEENA